MRILKKIVLVIVLGLFLTGCTIKSDITILEDGTTKESVSIKEDIDNFENGIDEVLDSYLKKYKAVLNFREYKNKKIIEDKQAGIIFTNDYDNICSYFQNTAFNQYVYNHINCIEEGNYIIIENDTPYIPYCKDCSDWPALPMIKVSITLPIAASEHNADEVNGNTYVWIYDENTPATKNFHLKIDKSLLKENEIRVQNSKKTKNTLSIIFKVLIVIVIVAVGVIFILSLIRKYRENKIEY